MTLHSSHPHLRNHRHGFTLLETMIAFALLAAFSALVLRTLSSATGTSSGREGDYWLAEFARSKAEEFAVLPYPDPMEGVEDQAWRWRVVAKRVFPDGPSRFDADIALIALSIEVSPLDRPDGSQSFTTIVARRP